MKFIIASIVMIAVSGKRLAMTDVGDGLEMFVKVRSTRAAQPAWLRRVGDAYEVELVDGEEGVSPGQACVFYDAPAGQARVLGGGFISAAPRMVRSAPGLREALAG